jgi:putative tryptophan/tyrosine transport system substrate-binding protein
MIQRREFITLLSGAAAAWPIAASAQQDAVPIIGYFSSRSFDAEAAIRLPFLKALEDSGYIVGRNIEIEYRFSEGHDERLAELAAELVRRKVDLLVATDRPSTAAAKSATSTTPIVFTSGGDPVQQGFVESFNRPGGNATGMSLLTIELGPKRFELVRELVSKPGTIAFVVNASSSTTPLQVRQIHAAAHAIGQQLLIVSIASAEEADKAFATMAERNVSAVFYAANLFFQVISKQLIALAARYRIPALYEWREFVTAGGLMSYSTDRNETGQQAGRYAARILKGEKPTDLPVVQSTRFELTINLNTAKALGLEIPPTLLARADEVIE